MLVDHELSGLIVGLTLGTRAEDVYRALIEATAFGTRKIIETFDAAGVPVRELFVAGGLLKNPAVMQIYADVTRHPLHLIGSDQGPALGAAIHAAVAAGAHPDVGSASEAMGTVRRDVYTPDAAARRRLRRALRALLAAARPLRPRRRRRDARAARPASRGRPSVPDAIAALREQVCALHAELPLHGLVAWTSGNLSARVPGEELMVIKASGIPFEELTPDAMVVCDLEGGLVEGDLAPSSDAATHGYVYRHLADVGGIAHTHSPYATAWAARGEAIPCVLTAMADEFGGDIPIGPFALIGDEEIGRGIVDTLASHRSPAVLMRSHGVFTLGAGPRGRDQGRRHVRGRRAHRAPRARRSATRFRWQNRRSTRSMTATRTSTGSAEGAGASRAPRIGVLGVMQELYDEMLPGITERQGAYARELGAALDGVADVTVAPPVRRPRGGRAGRARLRVRRPRRAAGGDAHLRAGDAGGGGARPHAPPRVPGQRPARAVGHARVGHGRPHLQPGHPRRAGHRQRDGARRAGRSTSSPATGTRRRSPDSIGGWARAAAAVTRWRRLRVAVFGYAMNGMGDIRVDVHTFLRTLGPQVDALAPGELWRAMGEVGGDEVAALIADEDARFEVDPRLSAEEREDHARMQLALRHVLDAGGYGAYSTHFGAIAEDGRFARLPLAAASSLMSLGLRLRRRGRRADRGADGRGGRTCSARPSSPRCTRWTSRATRS